MTDTQQVLKHMAGQCSRRAMPVSDLVAELQCCRDIIDITKDDPEAYSEGELYFLSQCVGALVAEIKRRRNIVYRGTINPDKELPMAIKERIRVADVIEWYTEVYYSNKQQMKFRCPLHSDQHPSGVIYVDEGRWHCFQCGAHGDIFDAVEQFERVDFPQAIAKLARHVGLDLKPIITRPVELKGGVPL